MGVQIKAQDAITKATTLWAALQACFDLSTAVTDLGGIGGDIFQSYYGDYDQPDGSNTDGEYPVLEETTFSNFLGTVEQLRNVFIDGATVTPATGHKTNIQKTIIGLNKVV